MKTLAQKEAKKKRLVLWKRNNPDKTRGYVSKWRKANPDKMVEYAVKNKGGARKRYSLQRQQMLDMYGRACNCCGESEERFLTLDHKRNDGNIERKKYGSSAAYRLAIKAYQPHKYEVLCFNCNIAKSIDGTCPHQKPLVKN